MCCNEAEVLCKSEMLLVVDNALRCGGHEYDDLFVSCAVPRQKCSRRKGEVHQCRMNRTLRATPFSVYWSPSSRTLMGNITDTWSQARTRYEKCRPYVRR